jgi:hypothetical protein
VARDKENAGGGSEATRQPLNNYTPQACIVLSRRAAIGVFPVPRLIEPVEFIAPFEWLQAGFLTLKILLLKVLGERQPLIPRLAVMID